MAEVPLPRPVFFGRKMQSQFSDGIGVVERELSESKLDIVIWKRMEETLNISAEILSHYLLYCHENVFLRKDILGQNTEPEPTQNPQGVKLALKLLLYNHWVSGVREVNYELAFAFIFHQRREGINIVHPPVLAETEVRQASINTHLSLLLGKNPLDCGNKFHEEFGRSFTLTENFLQVRPHVRRTLDCVSSTVRKSIRLRQQYSKFPEFLAEIYTRPVHPEGVTLVHVLWGDFFLNNSTLAIIETGYQGVPGFFLPQNGHGILPVVIEQLSGQYICNPYTLSNTAEKVLKVYIKQANK